MTIDTGGSAPAAGPYPLKIRIEAPFPTGELHGCVVTADGEAVRAALPDGRYVGTLAARPTRLYLLEHPDGPLPAPAAAAQTPRRAFGREEDGEGPPVVEAELLFDVGWEVPPGGELHLRVGWGNPCHEGGRRGRDEGRRFASPEHAATADYVGRQAVGSSGALRVGRERARFDRDTRLPVGRSRLTFGEIVALAGDFYAHFDATAEREFADAWSPAAGHRLPASPPRRSGRSIQLKSRGSRQVRSSIRPWPASVSCVSSTCVAGSSSGRSVRAASAKNPSMLALSVGWLSLTAST